MGFGITSFGAYLPRRRISRKAIAAAHAWAMPGLAGQAKGERSFASWDEDSITMAVEAARDCLADAPAPASIMLASTTLPYADRQNATVVAGALALPQETICQDMTGSLRAGTSALTALCRAQAQEPSLLVAADLRRTKPASAQELAFGAGAAALTLGTVGVIAEYVDSASISVDFVDHYRRASDGFDYTGEERWIRDQGYAALVPRAVAALFVKSGLDVRDVRWLAPPSANPAIGALIAARLKLPADRLVDGCAARVGDLGAAHPLLMLCTALEQAEPGDLILAVGFGQGCDAILFRATERIRQPTRRRGVAAAIADRCPDDSYLRFLSFGGNVDYDWGPRAEADARAPLTEQYRSDTQITPFMAGRCAGCGQVQFPQLPFCVTCETAAGYTPERLADAPARVATYTADWLQYHPSPPLYFGLVQFENGARVLMEFVDVEGRTLEVGTALRMVFRIKEIDRLRGFARYFWKAVPTDGQEPN